MGRGRGKGKKWTANHDDPESGEEEKIPIQKRRGRPQKPVKDEIDKGDIEKLDDDDGDENKSPGKVSNGASVAENGKKRKRKVQVKDTAVPIKEENGVSTKTNTDDSIKSNGYRHIGSRRKSKPRRAAEVGVECN